MSELRWTILLVGALFVLGMVLWERYKNRALQSNDDDARASSDSQAGLAAATPASQHANAPAVVSYEDEVSEVREIGPASSTALRDLPTVEFDPADGEPQLGDVGSVDLGSARLPSVDLSGPAMLRVEWPPEAERRIVAVRVVARPGARFSGRSLRQALTGEGFQLGKFDIFHWPLDDGRAVLSAASLTKPGTFSLSNMEAQQFAGLNLFAVLPGPLDDVAARQQLFESGRMLAQRLGGEVTDQSGAPLSASQPAQRMNA